MLLFTIGTVYLILSTAIVTSLFLVPARRRDDRQRAADDAEQMRALRPTRAPITGTGVFSTQS